MQEWLDTYNTDSERAAKALALLGGLLPALKAAKLEPALALR